MEAFATATRVPCGGPVVGRAAWRAMGSDAEVVVVGGAGELVELAVARVAELERRWSRFRPDSEVSVLNQRAGSVVQVSDDTVALVVHLVQAWRATHGAFDPTLLPELIDLGYAASWDDPRLVSPAISAPSRRGRREVARDEPGAGSGIEGIGVDPEARLVRLPPGTSLDPGGLGKGLAADLVTAELLERGAQGAMVSLGGDLRVRGASPTGPGWLVGVRDPFAHECEVAQLRLLDGGVATSSTRRRVWHHHGRPVHHLLDPGTGLPVEVDIASATVVAGSAAWAEAWTKVVMVRGAAATLGDGAVLDELGLAGFVVGVDGGVRTTRSWDGFAVGASRGQRGRTR